jgi:tetratricopeptide (TPR) repeat protein
MEALENFDRALALNPDYPEALVGKGRVLVELGGYEEARETFHRTNQYYGSSRGQTKDPDPISLGFMIYGAVIASSSLVVALANRVDTQRSQAEDQARDEGQVRMYLGRVDRALNRLEEAYRSLISVFDQQEVLEAPFSLGAAPIFADERLMAEIDRLRRTYFDSQKNLEDALDELASRIGKEMQNVAQQWSTKLVVIFEGSRTSSTVARFMLDVGQMLHGLSTFVMQVGERYEYNSALARARQASLDAIIRGLEAQDDIDRPW